MKKSILGFCILIALVAFQTSFLVHFPIHAMILNIFAVYIVLLLVFDRTAIWMAAGIGLFWDLFSSQPFGFWTLSLVAGMILIYYLFARYVQTPVSRSFS